MHEEGIHFDFSFLSSKSLAMLFNLFHLNFDHFPLFLSISHAFVGPLKWSTYVSFAFIPFIYNEHICTNIFL